MGGITWKELKYGEDWDCWSEEPGQFVLFHEHPHYSVQTETQGVRLVGMPTPAMTKRVKKLEGKYYEILYTVVSNGGDNETRHDRAIQIIKDYEENRANGNNPFDKGE